MALLVTFVIILTLNFRDKENFKDKENQTNIKNQISIPNRFQNSIPKQISKIQSIRPVKSTQSNRVKSRQVTPCPGPHILKKTQEPQSRGGKGSLNGGLSN